MNFKWVNTMDLRAATAPCADSILDVLKLKHGHYRSLYPRVSAMLHPGLYAEAYFKG